MAGDERLASERLPTDDTMRSDSDATPLDKQMIKAALFPSRARPARIGRYTILGQIGRGGMGVVYAGYDDLLDRKIAVKVLRGELTAAARLRLLREAQALARLNHPNVVAIHDVGLVGEQVYLAMEFIDGQTLGAWRRGQPRSWREIVAVVIAAGEGLAAAHAKGLVHRDIKPDNIMIGADGRVRVMDFGLARTDEPAGDRPELAGVLRGENVLSVELTLSDAVLGTPAYMSPEQLLGAGTDARTDQFCLCLTAWEALYDQRAFAGDDFAQLARRVIRGEMTPPPAGRDVPVWLRRVLERGLRSAADERHFDTPALLSALRDEPTRRRRMIIGSISLVVAIAGGFAARQYVESRRVAACAAEGASIAEVWNEDVQRELRAGLRGSGVTYAETTAERVIPYFAAQAEAWQAARTEACVEARVRGTTGEAPYEQSVWCLDERRLEMAALVAELSRASATTAAKAVPAAAGLSRIDQCRDVHRLGRLPALPGDRGGVQAVREKVSRVDALRAAGSYDDALTAAGEALTAAEATGWTPLVVAARLRRGQLLGSTGKYAEGGEALEDAYFQAVEVGALELAATAAGMLVYTVGYKQARHEDGRRWWRQAEVTLNVLGVGADDLRRAEPLSYLALVHDSSGEYEQARALHERALAIREGALGADHPAVADSLQNLGGVYNTIGAFDRAQQCQERALAIRERAFGSDHPMIAASYNSLAAVQFSLGAYAEAGRLFRRALAVGEAALGREHPTVGDYVSNVANAYYMIGDYAAARPLYERAIDTHEKSLGREHPGLGDPLNNLGNALAATGDYAGAEATYQRALAIREKALGAEHPFVAESLSSLAGMYADTGEYDEARAFNVRALAIREKVFGPEHPSVGESLHNLANVDVATGAYADARARYERALAIHEKAVGPEHPDVAYHLAGLAEVALAQGEPGEALAPAERAVAVRSAASVPPELLAYARLLLAKALWDAPGGDRERAIALARQARAAFAVAEGQEKLRAEAESWLGARGGP